MLFGGRGQLPWAPILRKLDSLALKLQESRVGMSIACIVAPFIGGQVADRLMQSQQFHGIAHIAGA